MRTLLLSLLFLLLSFFAVSPAAEPPNGCAPEFRALFDNAVVEYKGTGGKDVLVVTDPLCWHCRLAHKLLGEYPELYRSVKLSFFPRRSSIGSDMAAWVLEDAVGSDLFPKLLDFAYKDLKMAKTDDLAEARMIMLVQFTGAFPSLVEGTTVPELYVRLQKAHEAHVQKSADLARAVQFPGTPVLIVGSTVVVGYAPGPWLKVLEESEVLQITRSGERKKSPEWVSGPNRSSTRDGEVGARARKSASALRAMDFNCIGSSWVMDFPICRGFRTRRTKGKNKPPAQSCAGGFSCLWLSSICQRSFRVTSSMSCLRTASSGMERIFPLPKSIRFRSIFLTRRLNMVW